MQRTEILRGVPDADVDQVVADYESEGAVVSKEPEENGTWTVTAVFPELP